MIELAEIFRRHGPQYRAKFGEHIPQSHLQAMEAIEACHTEALGGHLYLCTDCGEMEYRYHSCKNRHCPKCQNEEATRWLQKQTGFLLPVPYFLATFTLPQESHSVARSHQQLFYHLLFQTSAAALKELALDPRYLGGEIGLTGILQSWTRDMSYHPHTHYLLPAGALSPDHSQWLSPPYPDWLLPVRALSRLFRGKFKAELAKTALFDSVPPQLWQKEWVVHCQPAVAQRSSNTWPLTSGESPSPTTASKSSKMDR